MKDRRRKGWRRFQRFFHNLTVKKPEFVPSRPKYSKGEKTNKRPKRAGGLDPKRSSNIEENYE